MPLVTLKSSIYAWHGEVKALDAPINTVPGQVNVYVDTSTGAPPIPFK